MPHVSKFINSLVKESHITKFGKFSEAEFERLHNEDLHIKDFKTLIEKRDEEDYLATIARRLCSSDSLTFDQHSILLMEYAEGARS